MPRARVVDGEEGRVDDVVPQVAYLLVMTTIRDIIMCTDVRFKFEDKSARWQRIHATAHAAVRDTGLLDGGAGLPCTWQSLAGWWKNTKYRSKLKYIDIAPQVAALAAEAAKERTGAAVEDGDAERLAAPADVDAAWDEVVGRQHAKFRAYDKVFGGDDEFGRVNKAAVDTMPRRRRRAGTRTAANAAAGGQANSEGGPASGSGGAGGGQGGSGGDASDWDVSDDDGGVAPASKRVCRPGAPLARGPGPRGSRATAPVGAATAHKQARVALLHQRAEEHNEELGQALNSMTNMMAQLGATLAHVLARLDAMMPKVGGVPPPLQPPTMATPVSALEPYGLVTPLPLASLAVLQPGGIWGGGLPLALPIASLQGLLPALGGGSMVLPGGNPAPDNTQVTAAALLALRQAQAALER